MPLLWSRKRTVIEWLAAQYRDMGTMSPPKAMSQTEADFAKDPTEAADRAGAFAAYLEAMIGVTDLHRIGDRR